MPPCYYYFRMWCFFLTDGSAAARFIFKSPDIRIIVVSHLPLQVSSPAMGEDTALPQALNFVKSLSLHHLITYLDVVNIIEYINLQEEIPWQLKFIILDIQHRFRMLKMLNISHIPRDLNVNAYLSAFFGKIHLVYCFWRIDSTAPTFLCTSFS